MNAYWMRWLDFSRLAGLFTIVASAPGALTTSELDRMAIKQGVFVSSSGRPLGKSSRYHHRRTLERLAFVRKAKGRFFPCLAEAESEVMIKVDGHKGLNLEQRRLFSERVLLNRDCYDIFWSAFVPSKRPHSIREFTQAAQPIRMQLEEDGISSLSRRRYPAAVVLYGASHPDLPIPHVGYNAVQAIHFGMRRWGVEQLRFLDELYQVGQGHHIFPIKMNRLYDPDRLDRILYEELRFEGDWAMPRVSDLLLSVASRLKVPIRLVRDRLQRWLKVHSGDVAPVFVSDRMILFGRSERIRQLALSGFLSPPDGGLVSHLKVHRGIADKLESQVLREDAHGSV